MPAWIEAGLSMVLREAATNIARHAQANEALISIDVSPEAVQMDVVDDGRGGVAANGNGLVGMRERVLALGGELQIESPKGQGTRLKIRVPVQAQSRQSALAAGAPQAEAGSVPVQEARA